MTRAAIFEGGLQAALSPKGASPSARLSASAVPPHRTAWPLPRSPRWPRPLRRCRSVLPANVAPDRCHTTTPSLVAAWDASSWGPFITPRPRPTLACPQSPPYRHHRHLPASLSARSIHFGIALAPSLRCTACAGRRTAPERPQASIDVDLVLWPQPLHFTKSHL